MGRLKRKHLVEREKKHPKKRSPHPKQTNKTTNDSSAAEYSWTRGSPAATALVLRRPRTCAREETRVHCPSRESSTLSPKHPAPDVVNASCRLLVPRGAKNQTGRGGVGRARIVTIIELAFRRRPGSSPRGHESVAGRRQVGARLVPAAGDPSRLDERLAGRRVRRAVEEWRRNSVLSRLVDAATAPPPRAAGRTRFSAAGGLLVSPFWNRNRQMRRSAFQTVCTCCACRPYGMCAGREVALSYACSVRLRRGTIGGPSPHSRVTHSSHAELEHDRSHRCAFQVRRKGDNVCLSRGVRPPRPRRR